ncbi:MAG: 3-dehydroquinate synthase [Phycisphaerales bacterium]|nr:3-dehydroquinate synthase [Phycisphaerales bacterium]MCI0629892.1 3-dehydroquinate synthase [Phycisphaerales bacterium]MCI0675005.1 3-dehydroquinate synthase [Phycisphaerales bacterium]
MPKLEVNAASGPYPILIEAGALARVGQATREHAPHIRGMLAADAKIAAVHGSAAAIGLRAAGYELVVHAMIAEEARKTIETVQAMYEAMLEARLERTSPVIALGGGIIGDTAGFAAATYQRGVPLIHVPTTLLAMVDASIGGKTGVNVQRAAPGAPGTPGNPGNSKGTLLKNMIGAFWQPRAVIIDPLTLRTLDQRELRCGLAECVKHGLIADAGLLELLETEGDRILALDMEAITDLIVRSVKIKAAIVEKDEREIGPRALLNLGHTFGHAIESMTELELKHGEAVAIGLCAAAKASVRLGHLKAADAARLTTLLARLGLPTRLPKPVNRAKFLGAMEYDKKVSERRLRLVLPVGLGKAAVFDDVPRNVVEAAVAEIA